MTIWPERDAPLPDITHIESLPFFNAFIKEGLRVYGSAPAHLEVCVVVHFASSET